MERMYNNFDELISMINSKNGSNSAANTSSFNQEISSGSDYREIVIDDETRNRISELREITRSIEAKLVHNGMDSSKKFKIDYENDLNEEQLSAVMEVDNPLLVIAGAGSGKTRVITYKVSYLIEKGILPEEILLLTFTRKASTEMLNRVDRLLKSSYSGKVLGGTFHSFSNFILRKYHHLINLPPNFTIIDTQDASDIIDLIKTETKLGLKKENRAFPNKNTVYDIISKSRNIEKSTDEVIDTYFGNLFIYKEEIQKLNEYFIKYKEASNLLDYDDLMDRLRVELRNNKPFREIMQKMFKYILVDEYQDTNNAQNEIVKLITGNRTCVTVVGDDTQSIYSFRGANFENILRFPARNNNCKVVKIEKNYRSNNQILNLTNGIIDKAILGFKKKLRSEKESTQKPVVKKFYDAESEARFIVDKILQLQSNEIPLSEIAILTRASWHSNYIQAELVKRSIPFVVVGGIKFIERRHVKDVLAFLRIGFNVFDAVSWHRSLKLITGIGKITATEIIREIHRNNGAVNFLRFRGKKFYGSLRQLSELINGILSLQQNPLQAIEKILAFYQPILEAIETDYEVRLQDLEILKNIASKYKSVEQFLSDFTLEPPSNKFQNSVLPLSEMPDEKPVTVSTIHSAKGLEWHTVFIPFALDGLIPSVKCLNSIDELEEERRLFYVACSRPKENLYITMPSYVSSWDSYFTIASRFVNQISSEYYGSE